jgi:phage shock protein A
MASSSEKRVQEDNARLKNRLHTAEADINKKRRIIADLEKKVAELEKKVSTVSIEAAKPQAHSANTYISAELSQDDEDLPDLDL